MRNLIRVLLVGFTATLMTLSLGATAQADHHDITTYYGMQAKSTFKPYGEHLYIYDTMKDGRSAVAKIVYAENMYHYWNPNGVDTVEHKDLAIPDGWWVGMRTCVGEYSNYGIIGCGEPEETRA